jgi:hypothetical protein
MAWLNWKGTVEERFWRYVRKTDSCWLWTGALNHKGYGMLSVNNSKAAAHRLSWEMANGPIPNGLFACHNCPSGDNPRCVNPAHLFLGTQDDNMKDASRKGRIRATRCRGDRQWQNLHPERRMRGEANGRARLSEEQVRAIRADARKQADIAAAFGVSKSLVAQIRRREIWRHVG